MTVEQTIECTAQKECILKVIAKEKECIPTYGSPGAAGADLKAFVEEDVVIAPGKCVLIPTGIQLEIPAGFEVQIRSRSGLALKHQLTVLNSPGTIDSDYRGEVCVILMNLGNSDFRVTKYMRIAQMVVAEVTHATFVETSMLTASIRGSQGFGHTGV